MIRKQLIPLLLLISGTAIAVATCDGGRGSVAKGGTVTPDGNMERSNIPARYKWRLDPLFKNDAAFSTNLTKVKGQRDQLVQLKGKLNDPGTLLKCLDLYFDTRLATNKLTLYANLRFDSAQKSTELQAMSERALKAMSELMANASFIRQEILAIDDEKMKSAYAQAPKLKKYEGYINELRRRRNRVLSPEAEKILSLAGDNLWAEIDLNEIPSDHEKTFGALLSDIPLPKIKNEKGEEVQLTFSNYGKFRGSKERSVRKDTVEAFFGTLKKYEHALAGTMAGQFNFSLFLARARGYDTVIDAYLDKDNIDPSVYKNLISAAKANLKPLHRYVALRKKIMGVKELHIYDLYTPMVKGVDIPVPYDEAARILPQVLTPLGPEYVKILKQGLASNSGWNDVYPHKDKSSGAFCASIYGIHPFVKLNSFHNVGDFSTLAHEYGHAMHSYLSMNNQPYHSSNYAPFIAEIASTINEKLLSDYLIKNAKNPEEKLFLLNELVETIRTTIFRQALFAEFELAAHTAAEKGTPLTAEFFNKTYGDLVKTYYGPDFTVGANDHIEWAYIPHFYYKYYVFTYATGLSSGIALADLITKGGQKERDAFLGMLKGGSSRPPLELLKGAGVDLSKPQAIEAAANLMDKTLADMEAILAKPTKQPK